MATNTLFNQPLMNKYLKKYKKELSLNHSRKEALFKWIKKLENGELKEEVANYGSFSRTVLEDILGYDYDKNIEENVKEDYGRGLSEFALKKDDKKYMVIELKGSDADLDKPQNRKADKRTPVDQAFDYAKRSGDIDWIFVSNYNEFRLYNWHEKQHKFISFNVEELKDPETFMEFMLIFSKFSTIENNLIEKLVSKTHFVERDLVAEFYKLYNETRLMIIAELEHIHPEFSREESVHYAQLILNRYIFICFAEDLGLLPGEISVESIENPVKNNNLGRNEIWHRLNSLFIDINEGNDFKKIYAYNGGLFSEDIEFLKIRDIVEDHSIFDYAYQKWKFEEYSLVVEDKLSPYGGKINPIYKNLMTISTFNFSSELDVNILGHIFENSIGDIEELKADTKGRRKKDGIFYTPEYITDYICRNTIIPYLSKSGTIDTVEDLIKEYSWGSDIENLDAKLKDIKIVDPACGSGAFLNKATDILLDIHRSIYEFKKGYTKDTAMRVGKGKGRRTESITHFDLGTIVFEDIEKRREILLTNIFGVDLNEESVEITKLSLFLKVCKTGLKLPNLDKNIKCGNSLIDDIEYAGDKAFNWEENFKEIFDKDGFNIVIGNPPYFNIQTLGAKSLEVEFIKKNYPEIWMDKSDILFYFIGKSIEISKNYVSFIISNAFLFSDKAKKLRNYILKNAPISEIINFEKYMVFDDASITTTIITLEKNKYDKITKALPLKNQNYSKKEIKRIINDKNNYFEVEFKENEVFALIDVEINKINEKIDDKHQKLGNILTIGKGMETAADKIFSFESFPKRFPSNFIKKRVSGINSGKYFINPKTDYLLYFEFIEDFNSLPGSIKEYLMDNEDILRNRADKKRRPTAAWWNYTFSLHKELYDLPKIFCSRRSKNNAFSLDESFEYLSFSNMTVIFDDNPEFKIKYILALLNSSVLEFRYKTIGKQTGGGIFEYFPNGVGKLPIPVIEIDKQKPFIGKVNKILKINKDLNEEINGFKDWLQRTYDIGKFSQKLDKFYKLSFDDFLLELKKKKVDTKPRKTQELIKKEFENSFNKIQKINESIRKIDDEINQMVYDLYGLTEDEIEIIENSLKN